MTAEGKREICRLLPGTTQSDVAGQGSSPRPFGSSQQSRGPERRGELFGTHGAFTAARASDVRIWIRIIWAAFHLCSGGRGRVGFSEMAHDYGSHQIFISHNSEGWMPEITVAARSAEGLRPGSRLLTVSSHGGGARELCGDSYKSTSPTREGSKLMT